MKNKKGLIITGSIILTLTVIGIITSLFFLNKGEPDYLQWKFESTYESWGENDRLVLDAETFSGTVIERNWWILKNEDGEELELKHINLYHIENGVTKKDISYIEEYKGTLTAGDEILDYVLSTYDINTWYDLTNDPITFTPTRFYLTREKSITDECETLSDLECFETYYRNNSETLIYSWSDNNIISDEYIEPKDVVVIN